MSWQELIDSFHTGIGMALVGVLLGSFLLILWKKSEARSILVVLVFFGLSLAGQLLSGVLAAYGWQSAAGYLRWFMILVEGMCIIRLGGITIFQGLLPIIRLKSPHILQDVLLVIVYIVWGLAWLSANEVDPTSIFTTSAVLTAVIGLSLQDTLGNILGGLAVEIQMKCMLGPKSGEVGVLSFLFS